VSDAVLANRARSLHTVPLPQHLPSPHPLTRPLTSFATLGTSSLRSCKKNLPAAFPPPKRSATLTSTPPPAIIRCRLPLCFPFIGVGLCLQRRPRLHLHLNAEGTLSLFLGLPSAQPHLPPPHLPPVVTYSFPPLLPFIGMGLRLQRRPRLHLRPDAKGTLRPLLGLPSATPTSHPAVVT
jgi:hypothetical protein